MPVLSGLKRFLFGKPIATKHAHSERLPKRFGLPVFASDALSSVAYASEEVLLVLVAAGAVGFGLLFPIVGWLSLLMVIVGFSYYQTIHAYPQGGGTYLVSTENLGSLAGRIAGAALLIDYVLTVAVSISSGTGYVVSAFPAAQPYMIPIACGAIALLAIANLRGAKESGLLFAIPTYSFIAVILLLVAVGLAKGLGNPPIPPDPSSFPDPLHAITMFLMLRAFAASCTALTGIEAISDGVQAFKPPEARNASLTLVWMISILLVMMLGVSWCAQHYGVSPMHVSEPGYKTLVAQLAERVFGPGHPIFYVLAVVTALILFLAANTAFADFPRLSSFLARDGYLPRQLTSVGDRLVFQNGIILLAVSAGFLIVMYKADTHSLIPLYALGVFVSFTLSQAGMVVRGWKQTRNAANWKMWVSIVGTITTLTVSIIIGVTKFNEGAYLIVVATAVMLFVFQRIKNHYNYLSHQLTLTPEDTLKPVRTTVLLLVPRLHRGILQAIGYAKAVTNDVRALHVMIDPKTAPKMKEDWAKFGADIPLVILESPYRSLVDPVVEYIDQTLQEDPNLMITVIVPQAVPKRWIQGLLHNNAAVPLKMALKARKNVVITNVRYFLS